MAEVARTADLPRTGELVLLALHSTITAIRTMPALFGSAALISVIIKLGDILSDYGAENLPTHWEMTAAAGLWGVVSLLLSALVLAPVAVALHRQVLLEETTPGVIAWQAPRIWIFAGWSLLVEIISAVLFMPVAASNGTALYWLAVAVFGLIVLVISVRWLLIFPAIAVESQAADWKDRILMSWAQTRGHFWLLLAGLAGAIVVFFIPAVLVAVTAILLALLSDSYQLVYGVRFAIDLVAGALQPLSIAVAAAVASWFYMAIQENPAGMQQS